MSIIRGPKPENNWYQLDKNISQDRRLSWQARGVLIYLLGKPDHWKVSVEALKKETAESIKPTSRDGIYSILKELESAGYVSRKPGRDENGRMTGFEYVVSEQPLTPNPLTAEPLTAKRAQASIDFEQGLNPTNSVDHQDGRPSNDEILKAYQEVCGGIFKGAELMTPKRAANVKKLMDLKIRGQRPFREMGADFWKAYFTDCLENQHWRGNNDRGWKADFEFLTRPENVAKVLGV